MLYCFRRAVCPHLSKSHIYLAEANIVASCYVEIQSFSRIHRIVAIGLYKFDFRHTVLLQQDCPGSDGNTSVTSRPFDLNLVGAGSLQLRLCTPQSVNILKLNRFAGSLPPQPFCLLVQLHFNNYLRTGQP